MTEYRLRTPVDEATIRRLRIGDTIYLSGEVVTARDQAHRRTLEYIASGKALPVNFSGGAVFHCGPIAKKTDDHWVVVAAGPTTSSRMETFEAEFVKKTGARIIIGKGGMGARTAAAMKEFGAVYCDFTGGAAVLAAKAFVRVKGVEWYDLGMPEALWILEADSFGPLIVATDSLGQNLHEAIDKEVEQNKKQIYARLGIQA